MSYCNFLILGGQIGPSLKNLAERRTDIFGSEETVIGRKVSLWYVAYPYDTIHTVSMLQVKYLSLCKCIELRHWEGNGKLEPFESNVHKAYCYIITIHGSHYVAIELLRAKYGTVPHMFSYKVKD